MRRYEVVKKKAKFDDAMGEMEERICRQFCHHGRPQCGIVYCLSRNDSEKVAAVLQQRLAARLGHRTRVRYPDSPLLPSPLSTAMPAMRSRDSFLLCASRCHVCTVRTE